MIGGFSFNFSGRSWWESLLSVLHVKDNNNNNKNSFIGAIFYYRVQVDERESKKRNITGLARAVGIKQQSAHGLSSQLPERMAFKSNERMSGSPTSPQSVGPRDTLGAFTVSQCDLLVRRAKIITSKFAYVMMTYAKTCRSPSFITFKEKKKTNILYPPSVTVSIYGITNFGKTIYYINKKHGHITRRMAWDH